MEPDLTEHDELEHEGAAGGWTSVATGDPRVDAALRRLGELDGRPVSEHAAVFERVHGQLVEVLGELQAGGGQAG